ncbi:condensation domain-containing protein, partial [Streptomyces massasporeus]
MPVPALTAAEPSRAPRGDAEERLASVYAEVLGLASVGAEDDFFALGGHSLLATRVVARVRATGTACTVRDVFEARTVAALAARLAKRAAHGRPVLTRAAERPELLPLSSAQRRLWFLHRVEGPSATYDIPLALRMRDAVDGPALRAALGDVVARHEVLRTVFTEIDGEPYQRILEPGEAEVPFAVRRVPAADLPAPLPHRADQDEQAGQTDPAEDRGRRRHDLEQSAREGAAGRVTGAHRRVHDRVAGGERRRRQQLPEGQVPGQTRRRLEEPGRHQGHRDPRRRRQDGDQGDARGDREDKDEGLDRQRARPAGPETVGERADRRADREPGEQQARPADADPALFEERGQD